MFPQTITVDVTEEDIKHGVRKSCHRCPVAKALERVFQEPELALDVRVDQADVSVYGYPETKAMRKRIGGTYTKFYSILPKDVAERIAHFDEHGFMEPFSFSLTHQKV